MHLPEIHSKTRRTPNALTTKLILVKISRQQRIKQFRYSFLMLEMLIAVVLVGLCALPLAQIPMRALQQEYHSAYRLQA